jgi:hypothetical protein
MAFGTRPGKGRRPTVFSNILVKANKPSVLGGRQQSQERLLSPVCHAGATKHPYRHQEISHS